jgi:hypothetical protein
MRRLLTGVAAVLALGAFALPGVAAAKDRDRDGLPDRWERRHHLSTKHDSSGRDPDRDRVDNRNEYRERTNPRDRDSDNDRRGDGREDADRDRLRNAAEDATGNDPIDPDTDDDGVPDGREHAGVIVSFVEGLLTLDLSNGDELEGRVTDETRVKCISERAAEKQHGIKVKARGSNFDEDEPLPEDELPPDEDWPEDEDLEEEGDQPKPEEDTGGHGNGHCSADWLDEGRRVRQARLTLTADGLVFEKIELVK